MIFKTIQWNIGGGKIREAVADAAVSKNYLHDGLDHISEIIKKYNPDVVFLQEVHSNERFSQTQILSKKIKLNYYFDDVYDQSHLEDEQKLGQAIISRFLLENHQFEFFYNPKFETISENGEKWVSHNKGVSTCLSKINNRIICLETLHALPFRKFYINPLSEVAVLLRESMVKKIKHDSVFLLEGDFNFDNPSLLDFLPGIFNDNEKEVILKEPTTPEGRFYDHIVFKNIHHNFSKVISEVLTDHFPVYSEFKI